MAYVGQPCTPAVSTILEEIGSRQLVTLNGGGGMGGSKITYCGIMESEDSKGFIHFRLTESKRVIEMNRRYIGAIEHIKLYKRTHEHQNSNYESNFMIDYFVAKGFAKLELKQKFIQKVIGENADMVDCIDLRNC
jgi:hypothetical protein